MRLPNPDRLISELNERGIVVFRQHRLPDVTNQRGQFYFVGSIQSGLFKLGKLEITGTAFYWFPDMPLGFHWSIHDANNRYPKGRIHMRLSKGKFRVYPGGQSLDTLISMQEIPAFSQIKGVIPVGGKHIGWVSLDALLSQLKPFRRPKAGGSTTINTALPAHKGAKFGQGFLLVEQNNKAKLEEWLSCEQSFQNHVTPWREGETLSVAKMEYVDLFKGPSCWLASVIGFQGGEP